MALAGETLFRSSSDMPRLPGWMVGRYVIMRKMAAMQNNECRIVDATWRKHARESVGETWEVGEMNDLA